MRISDKGLDLIKKFEGCILKPYQDAIGVWTIGWGNTYLLDGTRVNRNTKPITQAEADNLLKNTVAQVYEVTVRKEITRPLTQNQYDACVSFCYNLGSMKDLAGLINSGAVREADWCRYIYAGGVKLDGLLRRRKIEWKLYSSM